MDSFWTTAAEDPDRLAIVEDGGESITYGRLAQVANALSNGLRERGLGAGDTVACMMSNRWEFVALLLATHQVGIMFSPMNRHLAGAEAAYILDNSRAGLVVTDSTVTGMRRSADQAAIPEAHRFSVDPLEGFLPFSQLMGSSQPPEGRVAGGTMVYSSGTTGRPKGIRRTPVPQSPEESHATLAAATGMLGYTRDGVHLTTGPLYHAAPLQHTNAALQLGQTVVLSSGFDPVTALRLIAEHGVNDGFMVPTMLHRLLRIPVEERARYDLSSVRHILLGGAMCPVEVKRDMIAWWGEVFTEYYGASECGALTVIHSGDWLAHEGSVGRPRPGAQVKVCDAMGREVPAGEVGLLHLKSGNTFTYHDDEEKTSTSHHDGFFIPGDMGWVDEEGYVHLADRRTDLIVSGGVNIYPAEIESELLAHPEVFDAVVFGVPDAEWGHAVVAWVQSSDPDADRDAFLASLRSHLDERLARYKIPRTMVVVEQIPRNPAGKIARGRVREAHLQGAAAPAV